MTTTESGKDVEDYDIFDPAYIAEPWPTWGELREKCPIPHTDRWGGSWMPVRYQDISDIAHDTDHFSSDEVLVAPTDDREDEFPDLADIKAPPITSDPPEHTWARRLILPTFSPKSVARFEPVTRELCRALVDDLVARGEGDGAVDYAQQIPVRVIAKMLGVPDEMAQTFIGWVRGTLELGFQDRELQTQSFVAVAEYFIEQVADRKANPKDDIITELLSAEVDGKPVDEHHVVGTCNLILIAGIDTTWSAIGSALWHLASHPEDRQRLVAEPELLPVAIEELLRAYSPVTMARIVTDEVEVGGRTMCPGEKVLLSFPAANRDPDVFPQADEVVLDRAKNRHVAFGSGIHRCAGSNLARMELRVALEEWLRQIPEFSLADPSAVTWAGGQVRGPRMLPLVLS